MDVSQQALTALWPLLRSHTQEWLQQPTLPAHVPAAVLDDLRATLAAVTPLVPSPAVEFAPQGTDRQPPTTQLVAGTLLVCAVDGLHRLVVATAAERSDGEVTSATIVGLFSALIAEVVRHGGGVVKQIGDGLVAYFSQSVLGERHADWACAAALAMEARLRRDHGLLEARGELALRLRAGLHSGSITAIELGDGVHTELLLVGPTVVQAHEALATARQGEVVVSETTLAASTASGTRLLNRLYRLDSQVAVPTPLPPPSWHTADGSPPEATALLARLVALRRFLPAGLPRQLLHASEEGDLRPVTVLAANFCDFGHRLGVIELAARSAGDPSLLAQILNTYYLAAQEVIHAHGGAVYKVDTVAFGDRLLAAFGAPIAHEDAPLRALEAARQLLPALSAADHTVAELLRDWSARNPGQSGPLSLIGLKFRPRVALDTGIVFSGVVGTPERREYTLVGEAVRQAVRIVGATQPGTVALTTATYRALREPIPVARPATLRQEAGAPAVQVVQLVPDEATGWATQLRAPLVGRVAELDALRAAARAAFAEGGRVIALHGEAGLGKTRMVEELTLAVIADVPEALVIQRACRSYERSAPYAAVSRLLRALLAGLSERDEPDALLAQAAALLPDDRPLVPLLAPLLDASVAQGELIAGLSPEHRRERLHELVVAVVLAAAQRRPLVLILDDMHWADASSRAVVAQLAGEIGVSAVLLVLPERPGEAASPWRELPTTLSLGLDALTADESASLVAASLGGPPPPTLEGDLRAVAGNPLFIEEVLAYLRQRGLLRQDESGGWRYERKRGRTVVPAQLERTVLARLDRLEPGAQAAARLLAVMGQPVPLAMLGRLGELEQLRPGVETLVEAGLITAEVGPELRYGYRHPLVGQAVYESMLAGQRRELHALVAATLERYHADEPGPWLAVLAEHYLRAGQRLTAARAFVTAARAAQARYATEEAVALYRQAEDLTPAARAGRTFDPAVALAIGEPLGEMLALTGRYAEARAQFERLAAALEGRPAAELRVALARLRRRIGTTYEQQGQLEQALEALGRAMAIVATAPLTAAGAVEYASIFSEIGWVRFRCGELPEAQESLERALELLQPYGEEAERARVLNRLGGVAWQQGMLKLAEQYVQQSLAVHERRGDLLGQGFALTNLGVLAEGQGLSEEAQRYGKQAFSAHKRIGYRRFMAVAANNVAVACMEGGKLDEAAEWAARAAQLGTTLHDDYTLVFALLNRGRALTGLRNWDEAFDVLTRARSMAQEQGFGAEALDCGIALAELALAQGELGTAVARYEQLRQAAVETESEEYGRLLRLGAAIRVAQNEVAAAQELFDLAAALFSRLRVTPEIARTERLRAQALHRQ